MGMKETALAFFDACETGKGWAGCQQHEGAVRTMSRCHEIRSFAVEDQRRNVSAYGVFRATHTGQGGPVPPTGKKVEADYVYVMQFDGDRIRHMTKIWNDAISLHQLGWAS